MKVEFRKTFEKDLRKLRDQSLLSKIKAAIEAVEIAENLDDIEVSDKTLVPIHAALIWELVSEFPSIKLSKRVYL